MRRGTNDNGGIDDGGSVDAALYDSGIPTHDAAISDSGVDMQVQDATPVIVCAQNHGGCDVLASCTDSPTGAICGACPSGYSGTGSTSCVDINECAVNNGGCAQVCTNTTGAFTCSCNSGSVAEPDGHSCVSATSAQPTPLVLMGQPMGTHAHIGSAVALSQNGNVLAVGAPDDSNCQTGITITGYTTTCAHASSGAVYMFAKTGSSWTQTAYFKAINSAYASFGSALALSADGTTLAVSATGVTTNSGATYVFHNDGSAWTQQATLTASNSAISSFFGHSLSISADGNTVAIGAYQESSNASGVNGAITGSVTYSGAAYIFTRSGMTWTQTAHFKAASPIAYATFGSSVALSSDATTLAVGSNCGSIFHSTATPSVVIFHNDGTTWAQQATLTASVSAVGNSFGDSVSLSADGNTIAVGDTADESTIPGINNPTVCHAFTTYIGAVYVFRYASAMWTQQAYIKPSTIVGPTIDRLFFGGSVSLSADGNKLVVGSAGDLSASIGFHGNESDTSVTGAGAAYLFGFYASAWTQVAYIKGSNSTMNGSFGQSVALSADASTITVGATGEGNGNLYTFSD